MFVFVIDEAFTLNGGETVVAGKVQEGEVRLGMAARIVDALDPPRDIVVSHIYAFPPKDGYGQKRDCVGIGFREVAKQDISNWQVIVAGEIHKHKSFKASLRITRDTPVHEGFQGSFFLASKHIKGTMHGFPYDYHAKHGVGHPGQRYEVFIDLEQPVYIRENFPINVFGEGLVGTGCVLELMDDTREVQDSNQTFFISDEFDLSAAIMETFAERVEPFRSDEIDAFYRRLRFKDAAVQAMFPKSVVSCEMESYVDAMIEWSTPRQIVLKELSTEDISAQIEHDREFDTFFAKLWDLSTKELKELRKLAFLHEKKHSDAILLYGLYSFRIDSLTRALSYINEAALKKNDRAAYLLGWMNETSILYRGDSTKRNGWYLEAAKRGYQPAIKKIIDLIASGQFHAPGSEPDAWRRAFTGEDSAELQRIENLKQYIMALVAMKEDKM